MATQPIAGAERLRGAALVWAFVLVVCILLRVGWFHPLALAFVVPYPMQWTILRSDRVEIALTHGGGAEPGDVGPGGQGNWALRSPWKVLHPKQATALRRIVLDSRSYQIWMKDCEFSPAVAIRWTAGSDTATTLVCHRCNELIGWQGTSRMRGEVDPAGAKLLSLTSAAFPDDSLLQAIVARRKLPN